MDAVRLGRPSALTLLDGKPPIASSAASDNQHDHNLTSPPPDQTVPSLDGVAATAFEAARAKRDAVEMRYYDDAYASALAPKRDAPMANLQRRSPLINRGHYLRSVVVDAAVDDFLDAAGANAQVISLGAGFDTRWWRLADAKRRPGRYIELDASAIVKLKANAVLDQPELLRAFAIGRACALADGGIHSAQDGYTLLAADLRELAQVDVALQTAGWRPEQPTLVIAELVLVYLPPEASAALLDWLARRGSHLVLVALEPTNPLDAFGRTMVDNLRRRGCPLLGLEHGATLAEQVERVSASGWRRCEADDLLSVYESALEPAERARIERLEPLDELEEWRLLLRHYAVLKAVREDDDESAALFRSLPLHCVRLGRPCSRRCSC